MFRIAFQYLKAWSERADRKPLFLRGARQVGKTYLVRQFAKENGLTIFELNFEKSPEVAPVFQSKDPKEILRLLSIHFKQPLPLENSLLFLDEVQEKPEIFRTLRFFFEDTPNLRLISAGSLLDFALAEANFSMPVGRIEHLFLGPMQFEEFLLAMEEKELYRFILNFNLNETLPPWIHQKLIQHLRTYLMIGGMPEAIQTYITKNEFISVERIKENLLTTYRDDFRKYQKRVPYERLLKLFQKIPLVVGNKFKYAHIDPEESSKSLSQALDLLCMARVAYRVYRSAANAPPLRAEINKKFFKLLFLDVGLMIQTSGLNLLEIQQAPNLNLVHRGAVAEQFVGQHLLYSLPFYQEPELHYWGREKATASAEVDYVIQEAGHIVPIEVKSGAGGKLKSLDIFSQEKKHPYAIRFNSEPPTLFTLPSGCKVFSLPLYFSGQAHRLIKKL